jgi:hypothetical protein
MTMNDKIWLRSSRTAIYVDDQWYSTEDKSLSLVSISTAQGADPNLGGWNETKLTYNFVGSEKTTSIVAHIRQWEMVSAFTFHLETGDTPLTTQMARGNDTVRTVFPSFVIEKMDINDDRGFITVGGKRQISLKFYFERRAFFAGLMAGDLNKHAGHWDSASHAIETAMWDAPVILFNLTISRVRVRV